MKYQWFEGTVPRSGIKVYYLKGEIFTDDLGMVTDEEFHFSEVFSSLKRAESAGRWLLKEKLKLMYKKYYKKHFEKFSDFYDTYTESLGKYAVREVHGGFEIYEFDPLLRENYEKYEAEYRASHPYENGITKTHMHPQEIIYHYNLLGNLTRREVDGSYHFPEDDLPGAGLKFKNGDFVTSSIDNHKQVYIVDGTVPPEEIASQKKYPFWENVVSVDYIDEDDNSYICDYNLFFEAILRPYNGEVSEPMMLISKILKGEIDISKKLWKKIVDNKVSFSSLPHLKEAIADDKINSPEESMHCVEGSK